MKRHWPIFNWILVALIVIAVSYQAGILGPILMYGVGIFLVLAFGISVLWALGWFVFELLPFVARQVLPPHMRYSAAWRKIGAALVLFGLPIGVTAAPQAMMGLGLTGAVVIVGALIHVAVMKLLGKDTETY